MKHLNEEELILYYYNEPLAGQHGASGAAAPLDDSGQQSYGSSGDDASQAARHLEVCQECRAAYGELQRVLNVVATMPVPDRGADYEARVWQRVQPHLPARAQWRLPGWRMWRWAAAGAALAGLVVAAFLAGRFSRPPVRMASRVDAIDPRIQEQVLKLAVAGYLERSSIVLIELANANPGRSMDISAVQERADDLLEENRLYHQTAVRTGDGAVAAVLEELERVLLEITHAPPQLEPAQLDGLRERLRAEGILFRMRVLGSAVGNGDGQKL
jgi:hypothetical protein